MNVIYECDCDIWRRNVEEGGGEGRDEKKFP